MAVEGSVPPDGVIVPHLVVADASTAVGFYERAFEAQYFIVHRRRVALVNTST